MRVFTKSGLQIANDFERIVHGGRGDYIEIADKDIIYDNVSIPENAKWRVMYDKAYYIEYRSNDICDIMLYLQKMLVGYAKYKIGFFYVDPEDVVLKE